jgi:hypothetical protein
MTLLGIDPGKSGGLVVWREDGELSTFNMPDGDEETHELFRSIGVNHDCKLFIENPPTWAGKRRFAKQTVFGHSTATLQGNYKLCVGLALGMGASVRKFVPVKWQNLVECRNVDKLEKGDWKRKLKAHAEHLWPGVKVTLAIADALCILYAGWVELHEEPKGRSRKSAK